MKTIRREYGLASFGGQDMYVRGNRRAIRGRVLNSKKKIYDYPETGAVKVVMHPTQVPNLGKDETIKVLVTLTKKTFPRIALHDIETVKISGSIPYGSQDGIRFIADKSDVDQVSWIEPRSMFIDGIASPYIAEYF